MIEGRVVLFPLAFKGGHSSPENVVVLFEWYLLKTRKLEGLILFGQGLPQWGSLGCRCRLDETQLNHDLNGNSEESNEDLVQALCTKKDGVGARRRLFDFSLML